jgi:hypothetical protein
MYEMQGPGPVFGRWPAGCPAGVLVNRPSAGTGCPREVPVSRFFLRSGVAPGVVPVSGSDVFLLPGTPVAQGFAGGDLKFFWLSTRYPQRRWCCPPEQALFHQAIHNFLHRPVRFLYRRVRVLHRRVGFRHRQVPCPAALTQDGAVDARAGRSRLIKPRPADPAKASGS